MDRTCQHGKSIREALALHLHEGPEAWGLCCELERAHGIIRGLLDEDRKRNAMITALAESNNPDWMRSVRLPKARG